MTFVGARLRLARTLHDLTLQELSGDVASSPAALSQIENDKKAPSDDLVAALGARLGFESAFFFRRVQDEFTAAECTFRSRTTTPEREKKRVLARGTLFGEAVRYVNGVVALPAFDVPHLPVSGPSDVEAAANRCRVHWGLGLDAPIGHVGRVLERAGVLITRFDAQTLKVDAFSRFGEVSVIVLNATKGSASRTLFDLAHEAGHLVMHRTPEPGTPEREAQADAFASAFLLPRLGFARDFRALARKDLAHIVELKRHWRASAAAIIRRAYDLGLIDAGEYRRLNAQRMARGYHRGEPAEPAMERPEMMDKALGTIAQKKGVTPFHIAATLHWAPATFETVVGVPAPAPAIPSAPVVSLSTYRERRAAVR